jgi:xyloglucan 6-xylosyltransferase
MTERPVAADRRARQHRLLPIPVFPVFFLFVVAPCALFLFRTSDLALVPSIRIEFDRRDALSIAPRNEPPPAQPVPLPSPPPLSPAPPPPGPGADDDEAERRQLPPPRQLTDPPYSLGPTVDYDACRTQWLRDNPRFPAFVAPGSPRVVAAPMQRPQRRTPAAPGVQDQGGLLSRPRLRHLLQHRGARRRAVGVLVQSAAAVV